MDLNNALIYYKGSFDEDVLEKTKQSLQKQLDISSKMFKKMFAIFVELAQNISRHSSENNFFGEDLNEHGVGTIRVYSEGDGYYLHAANWILRDDANSLIKKCEKLNTMSHDELRKMKQDIFSQPKTVNQKGGNVGLIQVALKSKSPIHIEIEDDGHHDLVYFNISTKVHSTI